MSYKVGDKVEIKSWEQMEKEFVLAFDGEDICIPDGPMFIKEMEWMCGKVLTIDSVELYPGQHPHYRLKEDSEQFKISDCMIKRKVDSVEDMSFKYKPGDKFVIEIEETSDINCVPWRYFKAKGLKTLLFDEYGLDQLEKFDEEKFKKASFDSGFNTGFQRGTTNYTNAYADGANDAWEVAKYLAYTVKDGGLSREKIQEIFGDRHLQIEVLRDVKAVDAIYKYKEWKKKQEEEMTIDLLSMSIGLFEKLKLYDEVYFYLDEKICNGKIMMIDAITYNVSVRVTNEFGEKKDMSVGLSKLFVKNGVV